MKLRLALLAAIAIVPALLAFGLLRAGARGDRAPAEAPPRQEVPVHPAVSGADRWLGGALDPGPLSAAHADLAGVSRCLDCHGAASEVSDARCIACHAEIGERARREVGWHGTFHDGCRTCHAEHEGADAPLVALDHAAFQHQLARLPLRGAHAAAECEACHRVTSIEGGKEEKAFRYQGVPFASCASCHSDPHAGRPPGSAALLEIREVGLDAPAPAALERSAEHPLAGRDCADCHVEASFGASHLERAGFDHAADTHFPLEGAHAALACGSCHTEERRTRERREGLAPGTAARPDCVGCHEDPHRGAIARSGGCASCHSARGWRLAFDHDALTKFQLDPLHASVACASCHADQRFRSAGTRCADCHADAAGLLAGRFEAVTGAADPHAEVKCGDCHGSTAAANRRSALAARCVACHTPEYGGLLATWTGKLDALASVSALDPAEAERLRKSGVHNFSLAHERLRTSVRPR